MDVENPNPPSKHLQYHLRRVGLCLGAVAVLVFGLIGFGLLMCILLFPFYMFLTSVLPLNEFSLEHASVSLRNVTNDPQNMDLEWSLRFSVTNQYMMTNLAYQYINVSVNCLGGNSTVAVVPPFRQKGSGKNHLNATVHAPLPRFNAAGITLPFNVHMQPKVKYRSWLYFYLHDYTDAKCRNMKIDIPSNGRHDGTMLGGPFDCPHWLSYREEDQSNG